MNKRMVVPFQVKSSKQNGNYFEFSGYASTFGNVDHGDDRVVAGAFAKTIQDLQQKAAAKGTDALLPILWQHDTREPIGSFTMLKEDGHGLFVEGRLPVEDTLVSGRVIPQIRAESIQSMSIGYSTEDSDIVDGVRNLKEIKLWETSLVTIPMNDQATLNRAGQVKAAESFRDLPLAPRSHKFDCETIAIDEADFSKSFMLPAEAEEDCKLPFADFVDGKLCAVPQAIFSIAAKLHDGKLNLDDTDKSTLIYQLERYYAKMDLESPFQKRESFRIDDVESLSTRDLENLFQTGVHCTRKGSKFLAGLIKSALERDAQADEPTRDASDELCAEDFDNVLKLFNNNQE
jgi:HK97 family phage prohead protease